MRVLVTGGCGFLGSHFVRCLAAAGDDVVVLDRLADFGNLAKLEGVPHEFVQGDVADAVTATGAADGCGAIVNFAAETNLDASGLASGGFVVTDGFGAHVLLEFARVARIRYVQISTAEAADPADPWAASRAGADLQVLAYARTHGLHASVVRGETSYGPFQHPLEPLPRLVTGALDRRPLAVGGTRSWLHADDHAAAVKAVLRSGAAGAVYGVPGEVVAETDVAGRAAELVGAKIEIAPAGEPSAAAQELDAEPLRALGWEAERRLDDALPAIVEWYATHRRWWEPLLEEAELPSPESQYARRDPA
ncbi:MAG TPA: NAD-dependent epimerase/dehydratase family protein [Gaiellaceae bacterium]|nr:NAD-dependent epimerase/dehydratase family protein [Gaiellaceae bacterium]